MSLAQARKLLSEEINSTKVMKFTSESMGNLMMDLLDLAQIQKGSFHLDSRRFNLLKTIEDSI